MNKTIRQLARKALNVYKKRRQKKAAINASNDDRNIVLDKEISLSNEEIKSIEALWGSVVPDLKSGFIGYKVFKQYDSFSPRYVPSSYYFPAIIRALNPLEYYQAFVNKCLTETLFPSVLQPVTFAKRVNNCYFEGNVKATTLDEIIQKISECKTRLVVKQAIDSCCGRNIQIIEPGTGSNQIRDILSVYDKDFIIQHVVSQSSETARFNPTSLNSFRISTLFINGKISICSRAIKFGKPGNFVDNIGGDGGGIIVGVSPDGTLNNFGVTSKGEKRSTHNGMPFGGEKISHFANVEKLALQAHAYLPYCGIVGWDIALNENNEAVLIEANLWWPGTLLEQICSGPFFGDRTEEVINYLKRQS